MNTYQSTSQEAAVTATRRCCGWRNHRPCENSHTVVLEGVESLDEIAGDIDGEFEAAGWVDGECPECAEAMGRDRHECDAADAARKEVA